MCHCKGSQADFFCIFMEISVLHTFIFDAACIPICLLNISYIDHQQFGWSAKFFCCSVVMQWDDLNLTL